MNAKKKEIIHIQPLTLLQPQKLRVAGYARVSSDSADQLNSFAAQVGYYTQLIESNDKWMLTEIYADEGISGVSTQKRADFNRMIEDCREGKIDRIVTKSVSRFARNTMDSINTLRELRSMGVSVLFEREGIDTATLSSENLVTLYSLFAQQESISISQNVKRGNRMRMSQGEYVASNPPYGYRLVESRLIPHSPEVEIVQGIFRDYLQGQGISTIAKTLKSKGVPTKQNGGRWTPWGISVILKNERYIGDMCLQKKFSEDALPYRQVQNTGQLPQYYVKGTHEAIIPAIQFELVQLRLQEQRTHVSLECKEFPLSQKISCPNCGATYRRKATTQEVYWVCRTHDADQKACSSQRIPEEAIYRAFLRMYNKLKANQSTILHPLLSGLESLRERSYHDSETLATINKQIATVQEQNHAMTGLLSKGILDSALFLSQSNGLKAKLEQLKQEKARLLQGVKKDMVLDEVQSLADMMTFAPSHLTQMDEELFEELVQRIYATDNQSVDFLLLGGLRLRERL